MRVNGVGYNQQCRYNQSFVISDSVLAEIHNSEADDTMTEIAPLPPYVWVIAPEIRK